jgi:ferric-dicitrate binding protein FerR (iron transport regulator)
MNAKPPKPKLNRQILDEASDWFVDFRVGDIDSTARERFDLWLRQSPEHIRAYMEIANTYVALPALNPTRKVDVQQLIAYARSEGNVVPFEYTSRPNQPLSRAARLDGESRVEGGAPNSHPSPRRRSSRRFAVAAAASLLVATAATWFVSQRNTYATGIGERRSITLADGSTIDLNARSKIRIRFSKDERDVELLEGQALFGVAHDVSRPFIVSAGNTAVRAVGTQFDVYRKRSGTTVTVVEGRVAVYPSSSPRPAQPSSTPAAAEGGGPSLDPQHSALRAFSSAQPIPSVLHQRSEKEGPPAGEVFVSAGEQVTVTERPLPAPKQANVAAATAWTQHQLVFDASPLSDVVDGFNRYNTRQIVIEERALDDFHVSGVYSSTDPASLIRFLRQQPGIDVIETDEGVRITRK